MGCTTLNGVYLCQTDIIGVVMTFIVLVMAMCAVFGVGYYVGYTGGN